MHTDMSVCAWIHGREEQANAGRVTHGVRRNEELIYSMCVNASAAKSLFLEITGTNSLCHITS